MKDHMAELGMKIAHDKDVLLRLYINCVDETELRIPIRPSSADPDFGTGIPGFALRIEEDLD